MKKALMTASVASMLDNFNRSNIKLLLEAGCEVTLAADFSGEEDSSPPARIASFRAEMESLGCRVVQIDFSRKIGNLRKQFRSYCQLKKLAEEDFALVHCNSPICAAMTRLAFRKKRKTHGTRVIYTAHGFHFYRGAPVRNWLLYFPVEWVCAHWTDILNTVNQEDYRFAGKWLKAVRVVRLPGVGIDLTKVRPNGEDRDSIRRELGIAENEKMLLSVGELIKRKNQGRVIQALRILRDEKEQCGRGGRVFRAPLRNQAEKTACSFPDRFGLRYVICGQGKTEKKLKTLAAKLGLADRVLFLGYREDIPQLCRAADLFVFPSLQEGLPMALMEAIAVKTPVVCSDIRGNRELISEKTLRFDPKNPADIAGCICRAIESDQTQLVENHFSSLAKYRLEIIEKVMKKEYS